MPTLTNLKSFPREKSTSSKHCTFLAKMNNIWSPNVTGPLEEVVYISFEGQSHNAAFMSPERHDKVPPHDHWALQWDAFSSQDWFSVVLCSSKKGNSPLCCCVACWSIVCWPFLSRCQIGPRTDTWNNLPFTALVTCLEVLTSWGGS